METLENHAVIGPLANPMFYLHAFSSICMYVLRLKAVLYRYAKRPCIATTYAYV